MKESLSAGGILLVISYALALLDTSGIAQILFALGMVLIVFALFAHFARREKGAQSIGSPTMGKTGATA